MSSKTKIVVLHMKEVMYTGIFIALGILLLLFLIILFLPEKNTASPQETSPAPTDMTAPDPNQTVSSSSLYIPGIYNTELVLNDQIINVEVIVDARQINSVKLVNLNETVSAMFPLLRPAFDALSTQIIETQSTENITYAQESKYTSLVLLEAVKKCIEKAQP